MGFVSKLSLFLIFFLVFPNLLPTTTKNSLLCSLEALAAHTREFGHDGRDGYNGRDGRRGRDGENATIFVNDTAVQLNLSGTDGEDGEDGDRGYHARCDRQPRNVEFDLQAASGGDGGDGGDGGNGGNGGSVILYYTDPANLKNLYLRSEGGEGGRGGRGGEGGEGCRCSRRYWEIETCTGTPGSSDYRCTTERFRCKDGEYGRYGDRGREGKDGDRGSLTLIQQQETLPSDRSELSLAFSETPNQVYTLSKNLWQTRRGANTLLASGSVVADEYREFIDRIEKEFQLVWNAERSLATFYDQSVKLELEDNSEIQVTFPENVWIQGTTVQNNNLTQYIVSDILLKEEATQLAKADFSGDRANLTVSVVDLAGQSDKVETAFRIKYRAANSDPWRRVRPTNYRTRYEGIIPAELVTRQNNRFTINVGQLPIDSQYLRPGVSVEIELEAIRSFAGNFAEQELTWRGEIKD